MKLFAPLLPLPNEPIDWFNISGDRPDSRFVVINTGLGLTSAGFVVEIFCLDNLITFVFSAGSRD